MSATLYILRQQPDRIPPSLFQASDADIDIIFVEQAASIVPSFLEGIVVNGVGITSCGSRQTLTYDDLVEKIFSSEHVVVL
jgi:hypothetical protein